MNHRDERSLYGVIHLLQSSGFFELRKYFLACHFEVFGLRVLQNIVQGRAREVATQEPECNGCFFLCHRIYLLHVSETRLRRSFAVKHAVQALFDGAKFELIAQRVDGRHMLGHIPRVVR